MTSLRKVAVIWTAVMYFFLTFVIIYFALPLVSKTTESWMVALPSAILVVIIKFWSYLGLEE
jgi:succinate dehydrogenase hydrophobic anchor subunit